MSQREVVGLPHHEGHPPQDHSLHDSTDPDSRMAWRCGDIHGKPLTYEVRSRIMRLLDDKKLTHAKIAEIMNVHQKTVGKLRKAAEDQGLPRVSALIDGACVRIALENPRDTTVEVMHKLVELYPDLNISESTVWRTLNQADISHLRATFGVWDSLFNFDSILK